MTNPCRLQINPFPSQAGKLQADKASALLVTRHHIWCLLACLLHTLSLRKQTAWSLRLQASSCCSISISIGPIVHNQSRPPDVCFIAGPDLISVSYCIRNPLPGAGGGCSLRCATLLAYLLRLTVTGTPRQSANTYLTSYYPPALEGGRLDS
ncbi:hypothetical protein LZ32DRAFT_324223 [Colletotrichum eremochloae]|nr:hypothetical protein LZ32DRAFT_324223 [Colletotrichum eremochloae]